MLAAWNHYPPMSAEDLAARAAGKLPQRLHAHADMDIITLLYNPAGLSFPPLSNPSLICTEH
jgi:hypothetical protein